MWVSGKPNTWASTPCLLPVCISKTLGSKAEARNGTQALVWNAGISTYVLNIPCRPVFSRTVWCFSSQKRAFRKNPLFINLKGRVRESFPELFHAPQILATARARTPCWPPTWVGQGVGKSICCLLDCILAGNWTGSRGARTWTNTVMWDAGIPSCSLVCVAQQPHQDLHIIQKLQHPVLRLEAWASTLAIALASNSNICTRKETEYPEFCKWPLQCVVKVRH